MANRKISAGAKGRRGPPRRAAASTRRTARAVGVQAVASEGPAWDVPPRAAESAKGAVVTAPMVEALAAVTNSTVAVAAATEELGAELAHQAQQSFGRAVATARALIDARTLRDVLTVQRDFSQAALAALLEQAARVTEIGISAAHKTLCPVREQLAAESGKITGSRG